MKNGLELANQNILSQQVQAEELVQTIYQLNLEDT